MKAAEVAITVGALVAALAGCVANEAPDQPASTPSTAAQTRLLVEWIGGGRPAISQCLLRAGAQQAADDATAELLVHGGPQTTVADQANVLARLLDSALLDRPRTIVLDPLDYGHVVFMTRSLHDQGVPVVVIDEPPADNPGLAWTFVSADDAAVGRQAASELRRLSTPKTSAVLVVTSSATASDRNAAWVSGIREANGSPPRELLVPADEPAEAERAIRAALDSAPDVGGVFATDGPTAAAAARAVTDRPRRPAIVAADEEPDTVAALSDGSIDALVVSSSEEMARKAATAAIAATSRQTTPFQTVEPRIVRSDDLRRAPRCR